MKVMDLAFSRRLIGLRVNLSFLKVECHEYLLYKLSESHSLVEIYINYLKDSFTEPLLEALKENDSLRYIELQCRISKNSVALEHIENFEVESLGRCIVHIKDYSSPHYGRYISLGQEDLNYQISPAYPRPGQEI
mmetsp:Transcript_11036/g.9769  ORF Transcript_11036/g.9769 Transcript_11036/m.9769 type:complete len:135 (+) Transcript_11036:377-781(+)